MNARLACTLALSSLVTAYAASAGAQAPPPRAFDTLHLARLEVRANHVYLRTTGLSIRRLAPNGGEIDDRFDVDASSGRQLSAPNQRAEDEITLAIGETCQIGQRDEWHVLRLLRIAGSRAVFLHTGARRGSAGTLSPIHETITLSGFLLRPT